MPLTGCVKAPDNTARAENTQAESSFCTDFSFVVLGKTSVYDVYDAAPNINAIKETTDGVLLEYATQDGKYIHISFLGEKLIASAVDEVSESIKDTQAVKTHYCETDFQSIVVGESSAFDVLRIAPGAPFYAVSYGSLCELPLEDGRYIRIKFLGSDMIVGDIEVVDSPVG
jgi:hypothetical protein